MRRYAASAVILIASMVAGCTLDSEGKLEPEAGEPLQDSGTVEASPDVDIPDVPCFPPNKICDDSCVDFDDPNYGCVPGCDPCETQPHSVMGCSNNECIISHCSGSYWNCNGDPLDGCETDLWSLENCGACGSPCTLPNANSVCNQSECQVSSCIDGWGDCDDTAANGCEADLKDVANCGACGSLCTVPDGRATCKSGLCKVDVCDDPGRADCDDDPSNGCETDLSDIANCGACDRLCAPPHAVGVCAAGTCLIQTCEPGYGDCNGNPLDGCETNVLDNVTHCGACNQPCEQHNTLAVACSQGQCVPTCAPGWRDCNGPEAGNVDDGCERDVHTSTDCGDCDTPCAPTHAAGLCPQGVCIMGACDPGWADCDGFDFTGCETGVAFDIENCGQCDLQCMASSHASPDCVQGSCLNTCYPGFGDCNGSSGDGCETDLSHNAAHCGACSHACHDPANASSFCDDGSCQYTCDSGWDDCNNQSFDGCEVDLSSPATCGNCDNPCPQHPHATRTCEQGTCGFTCDVGWRDCNGQASDGCEADLGSPSTCGECNVSCPTPPHASATCGAGGCGFSCDGGWADCDGNAATGCEVDTTSPAHCGTCGNACSAGAHGAATCVNGACGIACEPGWDDCNGSLADGCETDLSQPTSCGVCAPACPIPPHASATCSGGVCGFTCDTGWEDCNGEGNDGCEVDLLNDPTHCGSCAEVCSDPDQATGTCNDGHCAFVCDTDWEDCDNDDTNGCEANLKENVDHCGDCSAPPCTTAPANASPACVDGSCTFVCDQGRDNCDGNDTNGCESDVTSDPQNCGACNQACSDAPHATASCTTGTCDLACDVGYLSCDGDPTTGCETNITLPATCGSCTNACPEPNHSTAVCNTGGTCAFWCVTGWADCDATAGNGCETDLMDPTTCGTCNHTCPEPAHSTATCASGGICGFSCDTDWDDCDGVPGTGCEVDLTSDPDHCGDCSLSCPAGGSGTERGCANKVCTLTCATGMEDCDSNLTNGCECPTGCCSDAGSCSC